MHRNTLATSRTPDNRKAADWRLLGGSAHILSVQLHDELFDGYQYPDTPIPGAPTGQIIFAPHHTPDLAAARELFPQHEDLWDAVRKDYWDAVSPFGPARHRRPEMWRQR